MKIETKEFIKETTIGILFVVFLAAMLGVISSTLTTYDNSRGEIRNVRN